MRNTIRVGEAEKISYDVTTWNAYLSGFSSIFATKGAPLLDSCTQLKLVISTNGRNLLLFYRAKSKFLPSVEMTVARFNS